MTALCMSFNLFLRKKFANYSFEQSNATTIRWSFIARFSQSLTMFMNLWFLSGILSFVFLILNLIIILWFFVLLIIKLHLKIIFNIFWWFNFNTLISLCFIFFCWFCLFIYKPLSPRSLDRIISAVLQFHLFLFKLYFRILKAFP